MVGVKKVEAAKIMAALVEQGETGYII
jgi:hypothetical protein